MVRRFASIALALLCLPEVGSADRGALTLEIGPAVALVDASPSQGTGSGTFGTAAGATFGVRYALSNALELAVTGQWESAADYFHSGIGFRTATGTVNGTLAERVQRYGAVAGVRFVRGYVWRLHLGFDAGWMRTTFVRRDLLDVSVPGNEHSFGLGLPDRVSDGLVLAPVAGVEWQLADHWAVTILPRLQILPGGSTKVAVLVPATIGYSWFIF